VLSFPRNLMRSSDSTRPWKTTKPKRQRPPPKQLPSQPKTQRRRPSSSTTLRTELLQLKVLRRRRNTRLLFQKATSWSTAKSKRRKRRKRSQRHSPSRHQSHLFRLFNSTSASERSFIVSPTLMLTVSTSLPSPPWTQPILHTSLPFPPHTALPKRSQRAPLSVPFALVSESLSLLRRCRVVVLCWFAT